MLGGFVLVLDENSTRSKKEVGTAARGELSVELTIGFHAKRIANCPQHRPSLRERGMVPCPASLDVPSILEILLEELQCITFEILHHVLVMANAFYCTHGDRP